MSTVLRIEVDDSECQGYAIEIVDPDRLARAVASVLVQKFTEARKVFGGGPFDPMNALDAESIVARHYLDPVVPADEQKTEARRYLRDGFLFQIICWLAAHLDEETHVMIAYPHTQVAQKGQDSVIIHFRSHGEFGAISVCEDKATENPRDTVRDDVWKDLGMYESDMRNGDLRTHVISALVRRGIDEAVAEATAADVLWEEHRRYRVRVTVTRTHHGKINRGDLYKGFSATVPGPKERRRGESFYIPDLRTWMDEFASKVVAHLRGHGRV